MKKLKFAVIAAGVLLMSSCASSTSKPNETKQEPETKKEEQVQEPSTNGLGITDEKYERSIKISAVNTGNTYLLKNVLEKLRAGQEEVLVAALGGSVTEGAGPAKFTDGYAYQFAHQLKEKYAADQSKVKFDGAGIGGTPSPMGLIRYEKDVVDVLGRHPDLLLIEFAVNDYQECSNTRALERLIRMAYENNTAVIVVYAAATYGNMQQLMSPVAQFYKVPEVSISASLAYSGINSENGSGIYYTDMVHPTAKGHKFMTDCIMFTIDKIDQMEKDEPFVLPADYRNRLPFEHFNTVYGNTTDSNVKITAGGFNAKDTAIQAYMKGGPKCFPENWFHNQQSSNESFVMELDCKALILISKVSNSQLYGKVDIYVDGKQIKQINAYDKGGWNNCNVMMLFDKETTEHHKIEIKMADGDEEKCFSLLAFGYSY